MEDRKTHLLSQQFQMTFTQDSDCCDPGDGQFLTIKTDNGGGGDFYIIETERWAFDNIGEFILLLKRFQMKHQQIKSKELE
jgi:hypothetical protein